MLFDSGNNNQRLMIFGTNQNLDILQGSDHWYCDGTFKAAPVLFDQLFIVHGQFRDSVIPLLYVLMPSRSRASYTRLLEALGNLRPNCAPTTIMSDFEHASILAFHAAFPGARQRGGFFHFSQCIWKHIQQHPSICEEYRDDADFALHLKMLAALAFVPPSKVPEGYDNLMASKFFEENEVLLRPFLNYFESTWVRSFNRKHEPRSPIFDPELWSCYESVLNGMGKTNNTCEGFNRAVNSMLASAHPTIFKLLDCLKMQQEITRSKIEKIISGAVDAAGREKYKQSAERLRKTEIGRASCRERV